MSKRRDGVATRNRILQAAREVFSERGFRDATIASICERADTNLASVNYHFGHKDSLYVAVWRDAAEEALRLYPVDEGLPTGAPAADRLRGHVRSVVRRMTDRGSLGQYHRLHMMERANPTGLLDETMREIHGPLRQHLLDVLVELLGPGASEDDLRRCEMSLISQCRMVHGLLDDEDRCPVPGHNIALRDLDSLVDHITAFSLAGIGAIRSNLEAQAPPSPTPASG